MHFGPMRGAARDFQQLEVQQPEPAPILRKFGGYEFEAWMTNPSADRIAAYRGAGVRCRRVKDVLYVFTLDIDQAHDIDRAAEQ